MGNTIPINRTTRPPGYRSSHLLFHPHSNSKDTFLHTTQRNYPNTVLVRMVRRLPACGTSRPAGRPTVAERMHGSILRVRKGMLDFLINAAILLLSNSSTSFLCCANLLVYVALSQFASLPVQLQRTLSDRAYQAEHGELTNLLFS